MNELVCLTKVQAIDGSRNLNDWVLVHNLGMGEQGKLDSFYSFFHCFDEKSHHLASAIC